MVWIKRISLSFLLILLVFLAVAMATPLRFIAEHLASLPPQVEHLQGTMVKGRSQLRLPPKFVAGTPEVGVLWEWCPLVWTPLAWCVTVDSEAMYGTATIAMGPNSISVTQLSLMIALRDQPIAIGNQQFEISGKIDLMSPNMDLPLVGYFPQNLEGAITAQDLSTRLFRLGNFRINLVSESDGVLSAKLQGGGDLFTLKEGSANLSSDWQYRYILEVESGKTIVRNFLSTQGKANAQGGYRLAKTGSLREL